MRAIAPAQSSAEGSATHPLSPLISSWRRSLEARNRSPKTVTIYTSAADAFGRYLAAQGMPTSPASIKREHVEAYITSLRQRGLSESTVHQQSRSLALFFAWLAEEGEVREDRLPTKNVKVPAPEPPPVAVLSGADIRALIKACQSGPSQFENRRDEAIIRLFAETGMRLGELIGLAREDIDLDAGVAVVTGKGRGRGPRKRLIGFGSKTANALDRYLRARATHRLAELPELWLGRHKDRPFTASGVAQMLRERARQAGLAESIHPHQFRHTFAHMSLAEGMQEGDVQRLAGWSSRAMLSRYGASAATERALAAQKKTGLGNKW
jgi:site-specific recombinase XerD